MKYTDEQLERFRVEGDAYRAARNNDRYFRCPLFESCGNDDRAPHPTICWEHNLRMIEHPSFNILTTDEIHTPDDSLDAKVSTLIHKATTEAVLKGQVKS